MAELTLIFGPTYCILGEVVTRGGSFSSMALSAQGDAQLGDHVRDWQIHGVPVLHDRMPLVAGQVPFSEPRTMLRDTAFLLVLRTLLEARSFRLVTIAPDKIHAWQDISAKPLNDAKRFKLVCAACGQDVA